MHDALSLEERGVPAVVVCTEPFIATVKTIARIRGLPDYPFVVAPHPVASLDDAGLARLARNVADRVEALAVAEKQPARTRTGPQPAS